MIAATAASDINGQIRRAMLALGLALVSLTLPASALASGPVYALLVGIDVYQGAAPASASGDARGLTNLSGAAADLKRVQALLVGPGRSIPDPRRVVVLQDAAATRASIGDALSRLIVRAAQDHDATVVFYFSGHGAQIEDAEHDQADWVESTIVPYDGRAPRQPMRDIAGRELRRVIEQANALGVSVVTIFDSCNSGTATRGFGGAVSRQASPYETPADPNAVSPLPSPTLPAGVMAAGGTGTHVHLAAAAGGEEATERVGPPGNVVRGDFTAALADAVTELPQGSPYLDVMQRVRDTLTVAGVTQHPYADGPLSASFLGHDATRTPLYQAALGGAGRADCPAHGQYCVAGGRLSGVTPGSTFEVYASAADALSGQGSIAAGVIAADSGPSVAHLTLAGPPAGALPKEAWLRETRHAFGAQTLKIYVDGAASDRARVATLVHDMDVVQLTDETQAQLVLQVGPTGARFLTVRRVPVLARTTTDEALKQNLQRLAKFYALLDLANAGGRVNLSMAVERACEGQAASCPPLKFDGSEYTVPAGTRFNVRISNHDRVVARYVYVLHLGSDFGAEPYYPPAHGQAQLAPQTDMPMALAKGVCPLMPQFQWEPGDDHAARESMERDRFLLIATDNPIDVSALDIEGGVRGLGEPPPPPPSTHDPLERLFKAAAAGQRGVELVNVGSWGAQILTVHVTPSTVRCAEQRGG